MKQFLIWYVTWILPAKTHLFSSWWVNYNMTVGYYHYYYYCYYLEDCTQMMHPLHAICVAFTCFVKLQYLQYMWPVPLKLGLIFIFCQQKWWTVFIDSYDRGTHFKLMLLLFFNPHPLLSTGSNLMTHTAHTGREIFINLYSLTSFQHIFMQYDVNIFFLWKCFWVILLPSVV